MNIPDMSDITKGKGAVQKKTRRMLGVPDWFIADCSIPLPGWLKKHWNEFFGFTKDACAWHDWKYFIGSQAETAEEERRQADKDLRALIKHNALAMSDGWWDRLRMPKWGEIYYWSVVKFGKRNWKIRTAYEMAVVLNHPSLVAQSEGRYSEHQKH